MAELKEALADGKRYESNKMDEDIARDASQGPSTTTIKTALLKIDVVGMLIERRIWAAEVAIDEVATCNAFSDSSPVTGSEIQGMIVDIFKKSGEILRDALPGATLVYGQCDVISKLMAFL